MGRHIASHPKAAASHPDVTLFAWDFASTVTSDRPLDVTPQMLEPRRFPMGRHMASHTVTSPGCDAGCHSVTSRHPPLKGVTDVTHPHRHPVSK